MITKSYGKSANVNGRPTGFIYGGGLGKDEEITAEVLRLAEIAQEIFPSSNFEVRCNTDGESGGAHDDKNEISLGVRRDPKTGVLLWSTGYPDPNGLLVRPGWDYDGRFKDFHYKAHTYSHFLTPEEATQWLRERKTA